MAEQDRAAFAAELARLRAESGRSLSSVGDAAHVHRAFVAHLERGRRWPSRSVAAALDDTLRAGGALLAMWGLDTAHPPADVVLDEDTDLRALATHAERSDVTASVLDTIDATVEAYAREYAHVHPDKLLADVRGLTRQVGALLTGRATLAQRRRVMVAGGWLALLAATLHVDLGRRRAASAARTVAATLGRESGHDEIGAWAVEVETWAALVDQDWRRAAALADAGVGVAPAGSGAAVQLIAQQARVAARLGDAKGVRMALDRAARTVDR